MQSEGYTFGVQWGHLAVRCKSWVISTQMAMTSVRTDELACKQSKKIQVLGTEF